MFRTVARWLLPNPLDWMCRTAARKGGKRILIGWNRGLGDIALGLYAMVHRIRELVPGAEITFLIRNNLADGFSMLPGVKILIAPGWERGQAVFSRPALHALGIDPRQFDLIIDRPNPTDWVRWQRGALVPRLRWNPSWDSLWKSFDLPDGYTYVGVQTAAETGYGFWRNWPEERWQELFHRLKKIGTVKVLLFGYGSAPLFPHSNVIDLRGKTPLFAFLSIVKNRCRTVILPDSGLLSMVYYLDASFPIQVISLWADFHHGVLKQAVSSPNPQLRHIPIIGAHRDLSSVSAQSVLHHIFPSVPLQQCLTSSSVPLLPIERAGVIILAGGEGSRLGARGPKGLFSIREKTLFQWICEKVPSHWPIAIMTSPLNHAETVAFFQKHARFGRDIHFFQQGLHPLLDIKKRPTGKLAPDGNGSVFKSFEQSGLGHLFDARGVEVLSVVPIENVLANPADPPLLSFLRAERADIVVQCIEREPQDRSMGVLVRREGKLEVLEYTELDPSVPYCYSYAGVMAAALPFARRMASIDLPLHWVWKKSHNTFAWKAERFIFDALPYADRVRALCYPREQIYAPLKSIEQLPQIERRLYHLS